MKYLFFLISLLFLLSNYAFAQIVRGKIIDTESSTPLGFGNVAIFNPTDSTLVTGANTQDDGSFSFKAKPGNYYFRAGYLGYANYFKNITIGQSDINLGTIRLQAEGTTLEEVTVEAARSMFESDIDKRVYNVENSIVAEGGSAIDLLSTLPSIQVDEQGGISMRGSGEVLIYINGRPSNLSGGDMESILSQFPANSIKSIELITNPSSRYDAAGAGGIINIILKKGEKRGLNGQANISAGTRHKYSGGLNLNHGTGKFNFYGNYNYDYRESYNGNLTYRENLFGTGSKFLDQNYRSFNFDQTHLIRGGVDYNLNKNSTLGYYFQGNLRLNDNRRTFNQHFLDAQKSIDSLLVRRQQQDQFRTNFETGITYNIDIDDKGQKLYSGFTFSRDNVDRVEHFNQAFFNQSLIESSQKELIQNMENPRFNNMFLFQLDYEKPLFEKGKMETGVKSTLMFQDKYQLFETYNPQLGGFERNDTISDGFQFNEQVHGAYLTLKNKTGKLGYQAGLRGELTLTNSYQENKDIHFVNNYFNLFPSVYLTYEISKGNEILTNYSRRINRPRGWALTPFYNVQDQANLRIGNPYLQPEFTDSYELGYMKSMDKLNFTGTLYHRRSNDIHTRYVEILDNNIVLQSWANANVRLATGLELINQFFFTDFVDATLSGNFFHSEIRGENIREGFNNSNFSWTLNLLSNIKIPKVMAIQIQGNYRGPIVIPQGEIKPMYGINLGLKRDLWDKTASISLNVSDVFNTRIFDLDIRDKAFNQQRTFFWESRIATLNFVYRFKGFQEDRKRQRRNGGSGYDEGGGDMF
jgi:iron complex outermembrane recepter protein